MEHGILVSDRDMSNSSHHFAPLPWSWIQSTTPQVNLYQALEILPDLGLKLSKTPSFLAKLDQLAQLQNSREQSSSNFVYFTAKAKSKDHVLQHINKMKAENFPISLLKIGSWQRVLINEGDLVAKCYFAKRKLVWEFLENGLKSKIEIQWSDILSLKAVIQENQPGILEIELGQPPSFHHEIDPQPRKHTQWRIVSDFTGGQALTHRRHYLKFPPGVLDKPLEKLLKYDNRLFQLIQRGYPTLKYPYFEKYTFGPDYVNPQQQQFSFSNVPTSTYKQTTHNSFNIKDSDSPVSGFSEHMISNQMPLWNRGMNNVRDSLITNQVGGMSFATSSGSQAMMNSTISFRNNHISGYAQEGIQLNSTISFQNSHSHMSGYVQQQGMKDQLGPLLSSTPSTSHAQPTTLSTFHLRNDLQNMLLNNSQSDFSCGITEGNLFNEGHSHSINNITTNYEENMNMVDNIAVMSNNLSSTDGSRLIYPQVSSLSQSQVPHENMSINMLYGQSQSQVLHDNMSMNVLHDDDNLFHSSANFDPTMQYFSNFNHEVDDDCYCS